MNEKDGFDKSKFLLLTKSYFQYPAFQLARSTANITLINFYKVKKKGGEGERGRG